MDVSSRPQQRLLHSCLSRWKDEEKKHNCRVRGDVVGPGSVRVPVLKSSKIRDSRMSAQHFQTHRHFRSWPRPPARRCSVSRSIILSPAPTRLPPLPWRQLHRSPRLSTWSDTCLGQMAASTGALSPAASVAKSGRSLAGPAARGELALAGWGPRGPPPLTFQLRPRPGSCRAPRRRPRRPRAPDCSPDPACAQSPLRPLLAPLGSISSVFRPGCNLY